MKRRLSWRGALAAALGALGVPVLLVVAYAGNVMYGMHVHARTDGTVTGLALSAPVEVLRDERGIPHIRAHDDRDLFFAQGYVEASDRLFQMDLIRRFVEGRLAEILGAGALASDERERAIPIRAIAARQWQYLSPQQRSMLRAFSDGVNAAMEREPTPVEFRILLYRPQPWTPQDSLAAAMATVLDLSDTWNDIAPRDRARRAMKPTQYDALHPLSDPCYNAPVTLGLAGIANARTCIANIRAMLRARPRPGSNEWAAGAAHTVTGRALLANDPHLRVEIPGVWYLVDLQAPGYHVAGAAFPGNPGVILGHNANVAWGATNGTVASLSVFDAPKHLDSRDWQDEAFDVRFGKTAHRRYYRTPHEFGVELADKRFVLVRWSAYDDPRSAATTFDRLDRARNVADALKALRAFPGPTQNFVVADSSGKVAYQLAGFIPDDPAWARWIHPASDLAHAYPAVPFDKLPHVAPSRETIAWTSNNKMYGPGYPLRLSPEFSPPYRAYRVAELLRARKTYDVAYFAHMQMDVLSLPERDLAGYVPALRSWDGRFTPDSRLATAAERLRAILTNGDNQRMSAVAMASRRAPETVQRAYARVAGAAPFPRWADAGAIVIKHPLAILGISFLNGTRLPGDGDNFTVHVQSPNLSQSFRAVWDVGDWDAGGIVIPQGESGEPGSPHYTDAASDWIAGRLLPLPFSDAAVDRATRDRETLTP